MTKSRFNVKYDLNWPYHFSFFIFANPTVEITPIAMKFGIVLMHTDKCDVSESDMAKVVPHSD